jgi:hypothetical protein
MTQATVPETSDSDGGSIFTPRLLTQILAAIGIAIGAGLFWSVSRWMRVPDEPRFHGSLLQPPASIGGLIAMLLLLAVATLIGNLLLGRRWFLGGLFVATSSLAAIAIRGGPTSQVLLRAASSGSGRNVFFVLLVELLILIGAVAALWNWLWLRQPSPAQRLKKIDEVSKDEGRSTGAAILAQVGSTCIILLMALAETGVKKQVLTSVFLASLTGTAIAQSFFARADTGRWYWIGPAAAGVIGYILAFMQPAGLEIGHLSGFFGALSRPLPLDYASLGCAGALLGYWMNLPIEESEETGE